MDVEHTIEFILQTQAKMVAEQEQFRADLQGLRQAQERQSEIVGELIGIMRQAEEERLKAEQERRRAEEENRQAHRRFEEQHRETDERFSILIKMMDEWIRERRNNRPPESPH